MLLCNLDNSLDIAAWILYDKNTKEPITYFHNNCVGKHILFLALCKENGFMNLTRQCAL